MKTVTYEDALKGFRAVGVEPGDTVLLQSAMRPFGFVEGAGKAIGEALYEALGKDAGTLVAPALCFIHEVQDHPVIDPVNDKSEMGAISEAPEVLGRMIGGWIAAERDKAAGKEQQKAARESS